MVIENIQSHKILDEREQAIYFHARQRRKSLAGVPEMFRSLFLLPNENVIDPAGFTAADLAAPITFSVDIRILPGATHRGLIFELGDAGHGAAMWLEDAAIGYTAGAGAAGNDNVAHLFVVPGGLPEGAEMTLTLGIRPGDGTAHMWINAQSTRRRVSPNGLLTANQFSNAGAGSFNDVPNGTVSGVVPGTSQIAPNGFEIISGLSIYKGQIPRQF